MMKKLAGLIAILLIIGVSLTLYLPKFNPGNIVITEKTTYQINQDSLKKPLLMSETLIKTLMTENDFYGLQLGMFSQLDQALAMAKKRNSVNNALIIKVNDKKRYWYLLIQGPYINPETARQHNSESSATLIRWPLADKATHKKTSPETNKAKATNTSSNVGS